MTVQQIQQLAARTDAHAPGTRAEAKPKAAPAPSPSADRVEISAQARARAAEAPPPESPELQSAREELRDMPPLDPKRAADILDRVKSGYYDQPQVVRMVAEGLTAGFRGHRAE